MEKNTLSELLSTRLDLAAWLIIFLIIINYKLLPRTKTENFPKDVNWDEFGIQKLTAKHILTETGNENLSAEEIDNIIETNYQLSILFYNHYKLNQQNIYIYEKS